MELGIVTGEVMLNIFLSHWVNLCDIPNSIRTDPDGSLRQQEFRRGLASKSIRLDNGPGDASWKTGVLGKTLNAIKQAAIRVARRIPGSVTVRETFDECTTDHNDLDGNRGFSPWQQLLGKTPSDKSTCENPDLAQSSVEDAGEGADQRLLVKEESGKAYIEEKLSLRKRRE